MTSAPPASRLPKARASGFRRSRIGRMPWSARIGALLVALFVLLALLAPVIAPYGETQTFAQPMSPWNAQFRLGTDQLGRDVLSRLLFGMRNSLAIAVATTMLAFGLGGSLGILAAIRGGWLDLLLSRVMDVLMAIPALIFTLMLLSIFGPSLSNLVLIIALLDATRIYRVVRSVSANVALMDYVQVARLRGEGWGWVMRKEILPNIASVVISEFGVRFCYVFLTVAALSFLGVGIQPPTADLGSMVRENAGLISYAAYSIQFALMPLVPALAVATLTISVNMVVDWLVQVSSGVRDDH